MKITAWLVFEIGGLIRPTGVMRVDELVWADERARRVREAGGRARIVKVELDESELLPRPEDSPKVKVELH